MILGYLKQQAEAFVGTTITDAVITVPAYFHDAQRQATKDAGVIAGLNVLRIVNEPTAASLAYGLDQCRATDGRERHVLVFDCGGGTHDISLLNIADGIFEVKATAGNPHLGGEDIDQTLIQLCIQQIEKENGTLITKETHSSSLRKLHKNCEELKRRLSTETSAKFTIEDFLFDYDFTFSLSRAKFEEYNQSFFRKVMEPVEIVLKDAKLSVDDIDDIVLVGGTTRIPKIRSLLKDYFGKEPCEGIHPDECVAYGATIQGAILLGLQSKDMDDFLLLDVTPLSLGIETAGDVFTTLIPRGTTIPTQKTQIFSTYTDNQDTATIKIMEGERLRATDNHVLGEFHLKGIPPQPRGVPQIHVSYDVSADGILKVSATVGSSSDDENGITESLIVNPQDHHLSKGDVERMIQEAKTWEEKDTLWKQGVEAKESYEQMFYDSKNKHLLRIEEDEELKELFTKEEEWLHHQQHETIETPDMYHARMKNWIQQLQKWDNPLSENENVVTDQHFTEKEVLSKSPLSTEHPDEEIIPCLVKDETSDNNDVHVDAIN